MLPQPSEAIFPLPAGSYSWGSPYGYRAGGFHDAVDFPCPLGTPIVAAFDGHLRCTIGGAGGWELNLDAMGGRLYIAHCRDFAGHAPWSARDVKRGDLIGHVGMTGNTSGPHAHIAIYDLVSPPRPAPFGYSVNPTPWLTAVILQGADDMTDEQYQRLLEACRDAGRDGATAVLVASVATIKEVQDQLRPIAEKLDVELPPLNVND